MIKLELTVVLISFLIFHLTSYFELSKGTHIYPLPSGNFGFN
jgi:hypothetical protein